MTAAEDQGEPDIAYVYTSAEGTPLFEHVRYRHHFDKKDFKYRYREGNRWVYGKLEGADAILYEMPDLIHEIESCEQGEIWWTEGERDAETLRDLGYVATSHHGAAGHATAEQAAHFRGYTGLVILCADHDAAGAFDVIKRHKLLSTVLDPSQVWIAYSTAAKDVTEHLERGHNLAGMRFIAEPDAELKRLGKRGTSAVRNYTKANADGIVRARFRQKCAFPKCERPIVPGDPIMKCGGTIHLDHYSDGKPITFSVNLAGYARTKKQ